MEAKSDVDTLLAESASDALKRQVAANPERSAMAEEVVAPKKFVFKKKAKEVKEEPKEEVKEKPVAGSVEYFEDELKKFAGTKYEKAVQEELEGAKAKRGSAISESTAKQLVAEVNKIDKQFEALDKARKAKKSSKSVERLAHSETEYKELLDGMVSSGELTEELAKRAKSVASKLNFVFYNYKVRKTPKSIILTKIEKIAEEKNS